MPFGDVRPKHSKQYIFFVALIITLTVLIFSSLATCSERFFIGNIKNDDIKFFIFLVFHLGLIITLTTFIFLSLAMYFSIFLAMINTIVLIIFFMWQGQCKRSFFSDYFFLVDLYIDETI